jgi:peptidoglycan/LPS O-acetylase OafA/YrhL
MPEKRPGRHKHGSSRKGRIWIVAIFCILRLLDGALLYKVPHTNKLEALLLIEGIWTTVLLAAIWYRRNWARVILAVALLAAGISCLVVEAGFTDKGAEGGHGLLMFGVTAGQMAVAFILIFSLHINRLTSRSYD